MVFYTAVAVVAFAIIQAGASPLDNTPDTTPALPLVERQLNRSLEADPEDDSDASDDTSESDESLEGVDWSAIVRPIFGPASSSTTSSPTSISFANMTASNSTTLSTASIQTTTGLITTIGSTRTLGLTTTASPSSPPSSSLTDVDGDNDDEDDDDDDSEDDDDDDSEEEPVYVAHSTLWDFGPDDMFDDAPPESMPGPWPFRGPFYGGPGASCGYEPDAEMTGRGVHRIPLYKDCRQAAMYFRGKEFSATATVRSRQVGTCLAQWHPEDPYSDEIIDGDELAFGFLKLARGCRVGLNADASAFEFAFDDGENVSNRAWLTLPDVWGTVSLYEPLDHRGFYVYNYDPGQGQRGRFGADDREDPSANVGGNFGADDDDPTA